MTSKKHRVDSLHINVGQGDSAIHLLVEVEDSGRPLVKRACLIDGGERVINAGDIRAVVKQIKADYDLSDGLKSEHAGFLEFDSVVITHWDSDHFEGIKYLMKEDLEEKMETPKIDTDKKSEKEIQTEIEKKVKEFRDKRVNQRCRWFQYNGRTPKTTLYAPYMEGTAAQSVKLTDAKSKGKPPKEFGYDGGAHTLTFNSTFAILKVPEKKKSKHEYEIKSLCNICCEPAEMIGMNFFNNAPHPDAKDAKGFEKIDSPNTLNTKVTGTDGVPVGMYCVASRGRVIGSADNYYSTFFSEREPSFEKIDSTLPNKLSIGAIILWKDPLRITHYFAGDAGWYAEQAIFGWICKSVSTISCMKLSHHGALNSTPLDMLNKLLPESIVISAGDKHGHPSWGALLYLNAWTYKEKKTRPVFATRAPYYCEKEYKDYSDPICQQYITGQYFTDSGTPVKPSGARKDFWNSIETLYKDLKVQGLQKQANDWKKKIIDTKKAADEVKNYTAWVTWQVQKSWRDNLSQLFRGLSKHQSNPWAAGEGETLYLKVQSIHDPATSSVETSVKVKIRSQPESTRHEGAGVRLENVLSATKAPEVPKLYPDISTRNLPFHLFAAPSENDAKDANNHHRASLQRMGTSSEEQDYWLGPFDEEVNDLVSVSPLYYFISQLHYRTLGLTEKPQISSNSAFLATEEWNCWFTDALGSTTLHLANDDKGEPSGVLFEMTLRNSEATKLKFDTRVLHKTFGLTNQISGTLGLIENSSVMVFGLDATLDKPVVTTFSNILSYIALTFLEDSPLIKSLGSQNSLLLITEAGARNAVWFEPGCGYRTIQRLQWEMDSRPLQDVLKACHIDLEVDRVKVITSRVTSWRPDLTMIPMGALRIEMSIKTTAPGLGLLGSITATEDSFGVTVTANDSTWTAFSEWLKGTITGVDISPISGDDSPLIQMKGLFGTSFVPKRLFIEAQSIRGQYSLKGWSVSVEISIKSVSFLVTYSSADRLLRGQLWLYSADEEDQKLDPNWEESDVLTPSLSNNSEIDLKQLNPDGDIQAIPEGIPTKLSGLTIEIDPDSIAFWGKLECNPPDGDQLIPAIVLGTVELHACYRFHDADKFSLELYCNATLSQPANPNNEHVSEDDGDDSTSLQNDTTLQGVIAYDDGVWTLAGSIDALNFGSLYQILDPHAQDDVSSVLGKLKLSNLNLMYHYEGGKGNDLLLTGSLSLGELELAMTYAYNKDGWSFIAELGSTTKDATLGTVVKSIIDPDDDNNDDDVLPPFIAAIPISKGDQGSKLVTLQCRKAAKSANPKDKRNDYYIFFRITLRIQVIGNTSVEVTFAQYRDLTRDPTDPAKRILKVSLVGLPTLSVPTIGELPQPFDEMSYLWVQDAKGKKLKNNSAGLTQQEVEYINREVSVSNAEQTQYSGDWLLYRDIRKPTDRKPTDLVLSAGSHFMIILKSQNQRQAVLDYAFQTGQNQKQPEYYLYSGTAGSGSDGNSAMAPYQKTTGPISISNIGLKYKESVLSVLVDASFVLGPVGFTFLGAAINVDLNGKNIQDLTLNNVSFSMNGLAVALDRPPLRLSGMFIHEKTAAIEYFAGSVVVGFDPYQFRAAGMYGKVKKPENFTTAFVLAKLEGPLVTLAFAEISGITGGFGYNSEVKKPAIETVGNFPFLQSKDYDNDLLGAIGDLVRADNSGAFTWRNGSMWLAAGMKVSAFKVLALDAVIVVSWNPSVSIDICGVAVVDIPKKAKVHFAHVELGILASLDFEAGVFKVEAQLAPSSYIFDSSCRLTGGFALYYWFNDKVPEHRGDWVFTIGGYHRAFVKPPHYPNPPRLGISWQVGKNISIVGEAYFAITPKCCMGGGRLRATLSAGPLRAWYSVWADFLIKYEPFYFIAEAGVSIGISCKVDLLITSFTVSVEVGASLLLEGPPLHGRIYIDIWVASFNINFGPDAQVPQKKNLEEFYEMVLQSQNQQSLTAMLIAPMGESAPRAADKRDHVFTCRSGLVEGEGKETTTKENSSWDVKGGSFVFAIDARFAISEAVVKPPIEFGVNPELKSQSFVSDETIYAKPMENKKNISSVLTVTIEPTALYYSISDPKRINEHNWQVTEIIKEVPSALWGKYNEAQDPKHGGNQITTLLNGDKGTIPLLMGLEIRPPAPKLANDKIGKFDAIKAMQLGVFASAEIPPFPKFEHQNPAWSAPADTRPNDPERYGKVQAVWKNTPEDKRKEITDALARGLAWRKTLTALTPKRLVNDLANRYMRAPEISVS